MGLPNLVRKHGVDYLPADNTANIRELIDYQELVVRVHSYLKIELGLTDKVFKKYAPKAGINAFLLEVLATYPEHADSFLRPLLKGVGNFGEDDPVMWLRERLDGLKVAARHDKWRVERGSWRVGAKILYWSCCAVWNHWVEGNAIRTLYTPKKKPELLKPNRPLPSNDLSENKED